MNKFTAPISGFYYFKCSGLIFLSIGDRVTMDENDKIIQINRDFTNFHLPEHFND